MFTMITVILRAHLLGYSSCRHHYSFDKQAGFDPFFSAHFLFRSLSRSLFIEHRFKDLKSNAFCVASICICIFRLNLWCLVHKSSSAAFTTYNFRVTAGAAVWCCCHCCFSFSVYVDFKYLDLIFVLSVCALLWRTI